jgi:hypothetical protein
MIFAVTQLTYCAVPQDYMAYAPSAQWKLKTELPVRNLDNHSNKN